MDFKKKLKIRLYFYIVYIVIGLFITIAVNLSKSDNYFLSTYGIGLIFCGIIRIKKYLLITKNEETLKKQEIAETDERNIAISNKAKSIAFSVYIMFASLTVIVLEIINKTEIATILATSFWVLLLIYFVSYFIVRKIY